MSSNDNLPSRARDWFGGLSRIQKLLAALATLVITIGGVASAVIAVLDLVDRVSNPGSEPPHTANAYLGVEVQDLEREVAEGNVPHSEATLASVEDGVLVTAVVRNSPAARAGVKSDDVITSINSRSVEDVDEFKRILKKAQPGDSLRLTIHRFSIHGEPRTLSIRAKLESLEGAVMPDGTKHS